MDACCAPQQAAEQPSESSELLDEFDPTMSECCRRDALEQRRVERAKAALMRVDRVDARTRLGRAVVAAAPPQQEAGPIGGQAAANDLEDDFLEDEAAMDQFRQQRLEQLKREARLRQAADAAGAGRLLHVTEAQAMETVRDQDGVTIIHLAEEGAAAGQELDEHLEVLAFRQRPVRFLRAPLTRQSRLPPELGLPHAPALLVFREGALVAKALTAQFASNGALLEERVTAWLRGATRVQGEAGVEAASDSSSDSEAAQEDDWREPCEICGRRYFHQHIAPRAVFQADARGGGSNSDSD